MIIKVSKNVNEYAMATVNFDDKFYVIPWEEIRKQSGAKEIQLKDITHCVNKNTVTFTLILNDKSLVVVYNAETGNYEYMLEGKDIIKAVCCDDKVVAVAKITNEWNVAVVCRCTSLIGSFKWEYESLNITKQSYKNDYKDYELVVAGNDAFVKIQNPFNKAEYMKYVENNFSIYGLYDYWKDKDISAFEGEPDKNSIYLEFSSGEPLTLNKITYCNDPKFAAGYLKYIVLGDAAYMLLLSDSDKDKFLQKDDKELENDYIPDIDYLLNRLIRNCSNKNNIVYLFEEMVELCDKVFMESDSRKALELLFCACDVCNSLFKIKICKSTALNYRFNIHKCVDSIKDLAIDNLSSNSKLCNKFKEIASKNNWDNSEKIIIKNILLFEM